MIKHLRLFSTLLLLAVASMAWGEEVTVSYGWEDSDNADNWIITDAISKTSNQGNTGTYAGKINSNHTYVQFKEKVYVKSFSFAFKRTSKNTNYNVYIETSTDGETWTAVETYNMSDFSNGSYTTKTKEFDGTKEYYVRFHCYNTTAERYVDDVTITYATNASSLLESDLALTNEPISLIFDLYNNKTPQTVNFTTSSTGAVTVSESEYVTTSVSGNTITVTPVKVTPSAQTITISQAADDTYASGTATFTVTVDNSTPETGSWVETSLSDLTADDIFVIVGNNGSNYAMSNDKGTGSAPTAIAVTVEEDHLTGNIDDNIKWNISGNAEDGYTFYPNGDNEHWLYCTNANNGVRVGINTNNDFSFSSQYLYNKATNRFVGIYNSQDWRCYESKTTNISNQSFKFYKLTDASATSISASDVNLAFDATSGSFNYTITNPIEGAKLTATTEATWISNVTVGTDENVVTFTVEANTGEERSAVITLTYGELTKDVTVTQAAAPVSYTTIPALFTDATEEATDVNVTFGNWVVSGVSTNGKNVFVTDGINGFVIFDSAGGLNETYSVGSVLSGTAVPCKLVLYNGFAELTNIEVDKLTIADGGTVTVAEITLANLAGVNTGALVSYENLTCSVTTSNGNTNYFLSDGTTDIQVYTSLYNFGTLEDGKTYNITGIYQQFNNKKEILPRSADDIVVVEEASITVNPNPVEVAAAGGEGTIDVTYNYITEVNAEVQFFAADGTTSESYDWIEAELDDNNNIYYVVSENTSSEARTAYLKVYALDDNAKNIYSELITITQAAAATPGTGDSYELFSGELVEGDYIIYYDGKAMNTTVTSDRLQYEAVSPIDNVITTDNAAIVWHIAKSGDYWTIYNAEANAYAAGTGAKNKAQMLEDGTDDKALWTVSGTNTYDFVNKANAAANVNANLRNNGTYGFACYATSTGGALSLYKKVEDTPQPETITVTISSNAKGKNSSGVDMYFGTLYYSNKNLKMTGNNLGAYPLVVENGAISKVCAYVSNRGDVIPAGTAVMLETPTPGEYTFEVVTGNYDAPLDNMLRGSDEDATTTAPGDGPYKFYALSLNSSNTPGTAGFYFRQGCPDGEAFENGAHKAYLAVPANVAGGAKSFTFGDETDGIRQIENGELTIENAEIYNLSGQRVNKAQKGIYIVNGKKVVVK